MRYVMLPLPTDVRLPWAPQQDVRTGLDSIFGTEDVEPQTSLGGVVAVASASTGSFHTSDDDHQDARSQATTLSSNLSRVWSDSDSHVSGPGSSIHEDPDSGHEERCVRAQGRLRRELVRHDETRQVHFADHVGWFSK